mmetsp:Transcript_13817/g.24705  ORF Transcript_13817/g.24705 Transcript_13817/m.24705 type:complete len:209 (-) Transcript_13817:284-910(-)
MARWMLYDTPKWYNHSSISYVSAKVNTGWTHSLRLCRASSKMVFAMLVWQRLYSKLARRYIVSVFCVLDPDTQAMPGRPRPHSLKRSRFTMPPSWAAGTHSWRTHLKATLLELRAPIRLQRTIKHGLSLRMPRLLFIITSGPRLPLQKFQARWLVLRELLCTFGMARSQIVSTSPVSSLSRKWTLTRTATWFWTQFRLCLSLKLAPNP